MQLVGGTVVEDITDLNHIFQGSQQLWGRRRFVIELMVKPVLPRQLMLHVQRPRLEHPLRAS